MTARPDGHEPFTRLPRGLLPLGYRNFLLFWIGYLTSNGGRWMELTGAVWLASELTDSPVLLGLLGIARAVPNLLLSPLAGVIADRVDQRRLLFVTQAASLAASFGLAILVLNGEAELWQVYVQVAVQASIGAFDASVRQALFPRLLPRDHLTEAVTLHSTATRLSQLVGPAAGGLLIAAAGDAAPFVVNGFTSIALMAAVLGIRGVVPRRPQDGSTLRAELVEGLRYILDTPLMSAILRLEVVFGLFQMNPVMITIFGREILGVGPEGLGGLLSAAALGSMLGVGYLLIGGPIERQGRFLVSCQLVYAGILVVVALTRDYAWTFLALAALGTFDSLTTIIRHNIMQLATPGRMRGRVMANMGTVTRGTHPLSQTQSGILAGLLGPTAAIIAAAGTLAVVATAGGRFNRALWTARRADLVRAPRPPAAGSPTEAIDPIEPVR